MAANPVLPTVGGDNGVWGDKLNTAQAIVRDEINTHEASVDPHGDRAYANTTKLDKSSNLADLTNPAVARTALQLGTAALADTTAFTSPTDVTVAIAVAAASFRPVNL